MQNASLHTVLRLSGFLTLAALAMAMAMVASGLLSGTLFSMLATAPDRCNAGDLDVPRDGQWPADGGVACGNSSSERAWARWRSLR